MSNNGSIISAKTILHRLEDPVLKKLNSVIRDNNRITREKVMLATVYLFPFSVIHSDLLDSTTVSS
jgi:hypothetical protein